MNINYSYTHCLPLECGDTLYSVADDSPTELTSANYPSNYFHSSDCNWAVVLQNSAKRLLLHFNDFSLEDGADVLSISSLNYTGSKTPLDFVSSAPGEALIVKFTSDQSVSRGGFSITMTGIEPTGWYCLLLFDCFCRCWMSCCYCSSLPSLCHCLLVCFSKINIESTLYCFRSLAVVIVA